MKNSLFISLVSFALLLVANACGTTDSNVTKSGLNKSSFQTTVDGKKTDLYVLTNKNGMEVCVTNFGGRIVSVMVPDKDGNLQDVVLGFDSVADYINVEGNNFGALIGRYGNRIKDGKITIDGKSYQLPQNNYGHCLHGGPKGYFAQVWDAKQVDEQTLELTYTDPDGFAGFPGTLNVKVVYSLSDDNELAINYSATTDKETVVNLTNHSYFNLSGNPSTPMLDEEVMINADSITPIDSTFMTNGSMMAVEGTPFDFRTVKPVGKDIEADNEQLKNGIGYDHNFVLKTKGDVKQVAASIYSPKSGIMMEVYTTEPGLQFYAGNFLDGKVKGKKGIAYPKRASICMETQHYPNSPNQKEYPSVLVKPGQEYKSTCIYKFYVKK